MVSSKLREMSQTDCLVSLSKAHAFNIKVISTVIQTPVHRSKLNFAAGKC